MIHLIRKKNHWFRTTCILVLFFFFLSLVIVYGSADVFYRDGTRISDSSDIVTHAFETRGGTDTEWGVYLFYSTQCSHCQDAIAYFKELRASDPNLTILMYDLGLFGPEKEVYKRLKKEYHLSSLSYPVLFIGDVALEGFNEIEAHFSELYRENELQREKEESTRDTIPELSEYDND